MKFCGAGETFELMHLIKLCVGVATVEQLESYRAERAHWWGLDYGDDVHVHRTRTMPKRAAEISGQGSIYWVMSSLVSCRQPILRLAAAVDRDGRPCCDIIMAQNIVRTEIRPMRPFQGWRYLNPDDAPSDVAPGLHEDGAAYIALELQKLGLL